RQCRPDAGAARARWPHWVDFFHDVTQLVFNGRTGGTVDDGEMAEVGGLGPLGDLRSGPAATRSCFNRGGRIGPDARRAGAPGEGPGAVLTEGTRRLVDDGLRARRPGVRGWGAGAASPGNAPGAGGVMVIPGKVHSDHSDTPGRPGRPGGERTHPDGY